MDIKTARAEYLKIRRRSHAETTEAFDALCARYMSDHGMSANPDNPENWIEAAKRVHVPCRRCVGTGRFITYTENGIPKGPGGACFRCAGKGYQTDADARRNYGADMHVQVF